MIFQTSMIMLHVHLQGCRRPNEWWLIIPRIVHCTLSVTQVLSANNDVSKHKKTVGRKTRSGDSLWLFISQKRGQSFTIPKKTGGFHRIAGHGIALKTPIPRSGNSEALKMLTSSKYLAGSNLARASSPWFHGRFFFSESKPEAGKNFCQCHMEPPQQNTSLPN